MADSQLSIGVEKQNFSVLEKIFNISTDFGCVKYLRQCLRQYSYLSA